jgi:hypothetical protein
VMVGFLGVFIDSRQRCAKLHGSTGPTSQKLVY